MGSDRRAVARAPDDPNIRTAAAIAAALKERLIIGGAVKSGSIGVRTLLEEFSLSAKYIPASALQSNPGRMTSILGPAGAAGYKDVRHRQRSLPCRSLRCGAFRARR